MTKRLTAIAVSGALGLLAACAEETRTPFAYEADVDAQPSAGVVMSKRILALNDDGADGGIDGGPAAPLFDASSDPDDFAWIDAHFPPETAMYIKGLIGIGDHELAGTVATYYTALDTEHPAAHAENDAVAFMLRDLTWRYGRVGAVKVLQIAVDAPVDGIYGPITRRALRRAERDPRALIAALNNARVPYEIIAGNDGAAVQGANPEHAAAIAAIAESYL